jgi:hypothetical protein
MVSASNGYGVFLSRHLYSPYLELVRCQCSAILVGVSVSVVSGWSCCGASKVLGVV